MTETRADGIVLVSPAGSTGDIWWRVRNELTSELDVRVFDHRTVPVDPGTGRSFEAVAEALIDRLHAWRFQRPVGVGISMGGMVLQYAAARAPHLFHSLVIGNTNHRQGDAQREAILRRSARALAPDFEGYVTDVLSRWFSLTFRDSNPSDVVRTRRILQNVTPGEHAEDWRMISALNATPLLPRITCPVTVIAADGDESTPVRTQEEIANLLPLSHLTVIGGGAHMSCVERPDVWARSIQEAASAAPGTHGRPAPSK
ncbi:alpha/beta hydrolase [Nocardiopsis sp. ATB16-24]|uniref:alpha/beta fold hydrolase n=1 Tax=Nocardiopsis sp. ATB16-24 TaxID=3019555 RepID=UPI002553C00F|nr:alpha/beta hydrolase [Nocardiopsis sp. ATB16-24]